MVSQHEQSRDVRRLMFVTLLATALAWGTSDILGHWPFTWTDPEPQGTGAPLGLSHDCPTEPNEWIYYVELVAVDGSRQIHWFRHMRHYRELVDDHYVPSAFGMTLANTSPPE